MAYSDFTLAKVRETFQPVIDEKRNLFKDVSPIQPSATLTTLLVDKILGILLQPFQSALLQESL